MSRHSRPDEPDAEPDDEILTTDEVAKLLKVPRATLYRWVGQGDSPPFYRLGKYSRWKKSEVLAWFEARQVQR